MKLITSFAVFLLGAVITQLQKSNKGRDYYINFAKVKNVESFQWDNVGLSRVSADNKTIEGPSFTIEAVGEGAKLQFVSFKKEGTTVPESVTAKSQRYEKVAFQGELVAAGPQKNDRTLSMSFEVSPDTAYGVNFLLAEHFIGVLAGGNRIFDVKINGQGYPSINIFQLATQPRVAYVQSYEDIQVGADGILKVELIKQEQNPLINAIEVYPMGQFRQG